MRYSSQVKPISYLKANAAEVFAHITEVREPMVITQNGEAKAVLQDVASFEETQETLALLKILLKHFTWLRRAPSQAVSIAGAYWADAT